MSPKLLLADDSITIQRVVELTFADQGVDVVAVGDGEAAIARIQVEQPDIVLADIGMPKRSGYDVSAFVKGHPDYKHIPVLLLAGAFEPVDEKRAEQVGCNGVLVKPFEPQHVISRVRELLGGAIGAPMQATPDVGRPVDRLASPRTLEFPRREEAAPPEAAPPEEAEALPEPPSPIDEDLGALPMTPDFGATPDFASASAAAPASDMEPATSMPEFNADESLDDYFARLGAALESPPAPPVQEPAPDMMPADMMVADVPVADEPAADETSFHEAVFHEPAFDEATFDDTADVPTLDQILGNDGHALPASAIDLPLHDTPFVPEPVQLVAAPPVEPPESPATLAPQTAESFSGNLVADAFAALLAVEEGEPDAAPILLPSGFKGPVITNALVDQIAQRVIERLAPGTARDVVAQVVSEVAERLVREEIDRIRSRQ